MSDSQCHRSPVAHLSDRLHGATQGNTSESYAPGVLLIVTDLEIGGTPLQVYRLARGLHELGVDVTVSCLGGFGPVADKIRSLGVAVHALGARSVMDIGVFWRLGRLIRQIRPDICHSFLMHANVATRLAGIIGRTHIVSTICTVERQKRWHMILELLTAWLADRIVCVSGAVKAHCIRWRLPADRLGVIYPGIDVERTAQAPAADIRTLELSPAASRICFVGRLDPVKRVDIVLKAFNSIQQRHPGLDWELLVAGDGPERDFLERLAQELGVSRRVKFLGFRDDVPGILKLCKVNVLASEQEGWGIATTEALAAGLVVVASDIDANTEQIRNGENGILVRVNDAESLAEGILAGLRLADSRDTGGARTDVANLDFRREAGEYLALYRLILRK